MTTATTVDTTTAPAPEPCTCRHDCHHARPEGYEGRHRKRSTR